MDKNEVITLSSDDETEVAYQTEENLSTSVPIKPDCKNSANIVKACTEKLNKNLVNKTAGVIIKNNKDEVKIVKNSKIDENQCEKTSKHSPEVVDLVDFLDKLDEDLSSESDQNNTKLGVIDLDETSKKKDSPLQNETKTDKNKFKSLSSSKNDMNDEKVAHDFISNTTNLQNSSSNIIGFESETRKCTKDEEFNENLKFFTEFVEYCGSLEKIPNDRVRLTKKLMKRYGEAECSYIKSQKFRFLVQKCRDKVNKNNLYLIAKEITEELSFRKKIAIDSDKSNVAQEKNQREVNENSEETEQMSVRLSKKRARFINKIIKKLDKLGCKIQELEKQEVDLSDEEDSTYVLLQRYRERFCQIYKRLCAYTSEIPDPNNRKVCFTESKYSAINKCIEHWLNKTRRFPDFSDIMKLIESQSSLLGLPSNRESVRIIAVEIFQKVGAMLQRRRIYDLWDVLCGFLDDGEDPANNDPNLDQILKNNFEIRLKKEQEIFQHYAELQEKEKLEPEEVEDEEANRSPVESGNEDDKEIEDIENCVIKRLDDAIKSAEDSGNNLENKDYDRKNSENEVESTSLIQENQTKSKETKNNYRNCKSLKWRLENSGKTKSDTSNSEDSSTGTENEKGKSENDINIIKVNPELNEIKNEKAEKVEKDDSDLEMITLEDPEVKNKEMKMNTESDIQSKRVSCMNIEGSSPKKKKYTGDLENKADHFDIFEIDDENENALEKTNEVFGVHCCQIFADNIFQDLSEKKKDWSKRKVFKDLTNVNRLMELHGRRKKMSGLFSPSFFYRSYCEFKKPSWKKRFKVSFRLVGSKNQKCALNQEKSTKSVNSYSGGDSDEKYIHSNSEGGGNDEGDKFFRSHGNGSEEDNNEDENKKNGGTNDEINDSQYEDDEEEEENENEKLDNVVKTEPLKQSLSIQKTEEPLGSDQGNKTPSENCFNDTKKEAIDEAKECFAEKRTEEMCNECIEERINEATNKDDVKSEENKGNAIDKSSEEIVALEDVAEETTIDETKASFEETNNKSENYEKIINKKKDVKEEVKSQSVTPEELKNYVENLKFKAAQEMKNKKTERVKIKRITPEKIEIQPTVCKSFPFETPTKKPYKKNSPSTSDEERVKRFLMHSPSSISITPPKKLNLSKLPSQAALQALATLRNLKDISATIVRSKPKTEDDVVVIESSAKRHCSQNSNPAKRRRTDLPVISSVQSMASTPTIVTVQGNAPGFEDPASGNGGPECDSSSIRISSVWGSLPSTFMPIPKTDSGTPGCSSRQDEPSGNTGKKKNSKKRVEYVVLE